MAKLFDDGIYMVVENPNEETAGIQLMNDPWRGLVYQYGDVQFMDGEPKLNFQRTIRRLPDGTIEHEDNIDELLNNEELNDLMGDILVELMEEEVEREQSVVKDTDKKT